MTQTRQPNPDTSNPEPFLPCERLDVYRLSLEFRQSLGILDAVRNISSQRDQLFRASDSVVLNVTEGAGRLSRPDKRRHYSYALGSAMECGAALALLHARGALRKIAYIERRMMVIRIVQMLSRLTHQLCNSPRGNNQFLHFLNRKTQNSKTTKVTDRNLNHEVVLIILDTRSRIGDFQPYFADGRRMSMGGVSRRALPAARGMRRSRPLDSTCKKSLQGCTAAAPPAL